MRRAFQVLVYLTLIGVISGCGGAFARADTSKVPLVPHVTYLTAHKWRHSAHYGWLRTHRWRKGEHIGWLRTHRWQKGPHAAFIKNRPLRTRHAETGQTPGQSGTPPRLAGTRPAVRPAGIPREVAGESVR